MLRKTQRAKILVYVSKPFILENLEIAMFLYSTHVSVLMTVKTITITEDAYTRLASRKQTGESFSKLVCRIMPKRSLMELAGILNKKEADELETTIKTNRKHMTARIERIAKEIT